MAMTGFETSEVDNILRAIKTWAEYQPEIDAVALVGSWARKQAKKDSDIDLMILTPNPNLFFQDTKWLNCISWHNLNLKVVSYEDRIYGVVKSRHLFIQHGQNL
jgi:Nucleotidyltransferase domain